MAQSEQIGSSIVTSAGRGSPSVCYVTTVGRVSGHPHRIEIWYLEHGDDLYLLSGNGERADWVRNMRAHPEVIVELPRPAVRTFTGTRPYTASFEPFADDRAIREEMAARYQGWTTGETLSDWATDSLVVRLSPA